MFLPTYLFLLPYLKVIPTSVFQGLFLYLAFAAMVGNEFVERVLLIFTEQVSNKNHLLNNGSIFVS